MIQGNTYTDRDGKMHDLIKFWQIKVYVDHGAVEMRGYIDPKYPNEITAVECEGKPMDIYWYNKSQYRLSLRTAQKAGNKQLEQKIQWHKEEINELRKRIVK